MIKDMITTAEILSVLGGKAAGFHLSVFDEVTSTNTLLREAAENGAPEMTVYIASTQTAGRGRKGRSFLSPADRGIYMSLLLRPEGKSFDALRITTVAGVAVCRALEGQTGCRTGIKWVNDIFIDGKKICGILTEGAIDTINGGLEYAILGIGINVYPPEGGYPPELVGIAGSVCEAPVEGLRSRIAAAVLNEFLTLYNSIGDGAYMTEYRSRSVVLGREIKVIRLPSGSQQTGESALACAIDDECRLKVRFRDGHEEYLSSGEISVRL